MQKLSTLRSEKKILHKKISWLEVYIFVFYFGVWIYTQKIKIFGRGNENYSDLKNDPYKINMTNLYIIKTHSAKFVLIFWNWRSKNDTILLHRNYHLLCSPYWVSINFRHKFIAFLWWLYFKTGVFNDVHPWRSRVFKTQEKDDFSNFVEILHFLNI